MDTRHMISVFVEDDVGNSNISFLLNVWNSRNRAVGEEAWLLIHQDVRGCEAIRRFAEETFTSWLCRKMVNRLQISHILHTTLVN